jgi:hypothetical protein
MAREVKTRARLLGQARLVGALLTMSGGSVGLVGGVAEGVVGGVVGGVMGGVVGGVVEGVVGGVGTLNLFRDQ